VVDLLTKALGQVRFQELRDRIDVKDVSDHTHG
jgi:hypothetical protein